MRKIPILTVMLFCAAIYAQDAKDSRAQPLAAAQQAPGQPALPTAAQPAAATGQPAPAQAVTSEPAGVAPAAPVAAEVVAPVPTAPVAAEVVAPIPTAPVAAEVVAPAPAAPAAAPAPVMPIASEVVAPAPAPVVPIASAVIAPGTAGPKSAAPKLGDPAAARTLASARASIDWVTPDSIRLKPAAGHPADSARPAATIASADAAIASAVSAAASAWASMDSALIQRGFPPAQRPRVAIDPAAVKAALPELTVASKLPWAAKDRKTEISGMTSVSVLAGWGFAPHINSEPHFKPWWKPGFYVSYKDINPNRSFSKNLSIDVCMYSFDESEYSRYYKEKGDETRAGLSWVSVEPLLVLDLDYYARYYPFREFIAPYVFSSVGVCGLLGGGSEDNRGVRHNNDKLLSGGENLVGDAYLLRIAAGLGIEALLYDEVRIFADAQYSLRLGLFSFLKEKDGAVTLNGLVPQLPIRVGILVPFKVRERT